VLMLPRLLLENPSAYNVSWGVMSISGEGKAWVAFGSCVLAGMPLSSRPVNAPELLTFWGSSWAQAFF